MKKAINRQSQATVTELFNLVFNCYHSMEMIDLTARLVYNALGYENTKYLDILTETLSADAVTVSSKDRKAINTCIEKIKTNITSYKRNSYVSSVKGE